MLEAVALVGHMLNTGPDVVRGLVQEVPRTAKSEVAHLVKLDFLLKGGRPQIAFDMEEVPLTDDGAKRDFLARWRWVGNASGNNPQLFLTTNNLEYLAGPAIANLLSDLEEAGELDTQFGCKVQDLRQAFFCSLPDGSAVLDIEKLGLVEPGEFEKQWSAAKSKKGQEKAKEVRKWVAKIVQEAALRRLGLKKQDVSLWTLLADGQPLAEDPAYERVILRYKMAGFAGEKIGVTGTCSICGQRAEVSYNAFSRLDFLKYYITDKLGFASGQGEDGFGRNFQVCKNCFQELMLAERFVRQNLSLQVGLLNFLVIPFFLLPPPEDMVRPELPLWVEKLKLRVSGLVSMAPWLKRVAGPTESLEADLQDLLEDLPYENQALLNFLFYQKAQSELRIFALIKDVAPSRISHLICRGNSINRVATELFGAKVGGWWPDLSKIYELIPLNTGGQVEHKKVLYVYEGLLKSRPISRHFLVQQFVALAKIYRLKQFKGTNLREPAQGFEEAAMAEKLVEANLLLKLLQEENLLIKEVEELPETTGTGLKPEMDEYFKAMHYSEPEAALFLLGYMLNEVGRAQQDAGHKAKPVLEKLNYQGMSLARVRQLANILFEKLHQYGVLQFNEGYYAEMKRIFDAYRDSSWPLGPEENVFFILAGYAYGVRAAIAAARKKKGDEQRGGDH